MCFLFPLAADALDGIIERIRNETLCICPTCGKSHTRGITLGVAIMEHIHRPKKEKKWAERVRSYVRSQWAPPLVTSETLPVVTITDAQSHTLVGPAVSGVFPQEVADQIYLESRGHFSNCDFFLGLESMVQSYFDMLRRLQLKGLVGARVQASTGASAGVIVGIVFGALAGLLLAVAAVLLVVRRCDAPYISSKSEYQTRRYFGELSIKPGRHNTKAAHPAAPYLVRIPATSAATAASEPPDVTKPLTSGLLLPPPPPPPPHTPSLSNGRYEAPKGGCETPGGLDVSDPSDSSDDERSTTDSEEECSCCSSVGDGHESIPIASSSSAGTHVTV
ncbi:hypothetical protein HPB49_016986 [Dermacentor silvarum]|uniref:Uncharacterized protein n=1 Tax=Dermacentor silvarum TaxID=543639 RepID=A0ACB8CS40_DERSI|nr:hypothetical protein HPB49_016986 [Dermacentor silvarum]